ncbi:hypothetical protein Patl1_09024 [Pistacia atlantica]|uniref:Uncharacterized protein n=1 Tax=Pistacia atlantica TaxID=434234 RepID=A0ACC1AK58_9ROSI|nr:hypothetical protein Patl1_09024 [Pistacia atlantica]
MTESTPVNPDSSAGAIVDYAEIIVVRHGETGWNADGRIQGHLDVELNHVGRQQAAAVANRISKEMKISAVYSSDLKRAMETAHIIASTCDIPEVTTDPELRERHLGDLQGFTLQEAAALKPDAYLASLSPRTDQEIPGGGESFDQLYNRCISSLQKIGKKHRGEKVVLVTHGGVVRAFHKRSAPTEKLPGKIMNASVNIFRLAEEEWMINTWGDISHLSETGYLETAFGGDKTSA